MTDLNRRERELLAELADLRRRMARTETKEYGSGSGSVDTFLELTDTPSAYTGSANTFVRVNSGTTALTFGTVDWADVYTKPSTFAPAAHAGSHKAGSADPVGTATPTANAIPYADGSGLLDAWISNAGTATLGKSAFTSTHFTISGGTVSLGTTVPRYSGVPTTNQIAEWTGNGTVRGISTVPRYSGVPTAGAITYWTGNGTVAHAAFGTADIVRFSGTAGAGAIAYWTGNGTVAAVSFGTADVVRLDAIQTLTNKTLTTPTIASFANATHTHANAAGGGGLPNYAYISGTPTAAAITYWANAGTVAHASFGTANVARRDIGNALNGNQSISGGSVVIGGTVAEAQLHIIASDPSATPDANAVAIFERNDNAFFQFLTPANKFSGFYFGDPGTAKAGEFSYSHTSDQFQMRFSGTLFALFQASGMGIGPSTVSARLHVLESTLGNEVQRLESTATNDDVRESVYQARGTTTSAVTATIFTLAIPASKTVAAEAVVVARRTGGASGAAEDGAAYIVRGVWKNVASTALIIGSYTTTVIGESQAGWHAEWAESGSDALLWVTGATNNNITWHATIRSWQVGT